MNVSVAVNLPAEVEDRVRAASGDLAVPVREGFVLDLFRRGLLTRHELSQTLGLDRAETYALLKRYQIFDESLTHGDVDSDVAAARELSARPRQ